MWIPVVSLLQKLLQALELAHLQVSFVRVLVADKCAAVRGEREQSGVSVTNGRTCQNLRRANGQSAAEAGGGLMDGVRADVDLVKVRGEEVKEESVRRGGCR